MSSSDNPAGAAPQAAGTGGEGRLAQVIATRGGRAPPEAPFVIEHREALIYMLCEAAELEHGIMCQYLFAAFSLKHSADEGLTPSQLAAVRRWRKVISHVATQEMLHLALVHNLLSAIGAAPHMARPNFPHPASHYPAGVRLSLLPFGDQALRHFMFLERPEGMQLHDAKGLTAFGRAAPSMEPGDIVPRGQDFATVGHLYRSIEQGFAHLAEKYGERWLFVGPPRAQATATHFGWPELVPVTDLASAQYAIDTILEQGEGPRGHWRDAHFGQFVQILDEFEQAREADRAFDPARPVVAANVRPSERDPYVPLITDSVTSRVTDLFNVAYEILLQIFERFFAHTEETDAQLATLADTTIVLMLRVIKPLGDLITSLPAGREYPGMTAGPSFELFYESDYLMPHRQAAWALLAERIDEAASFCGEIRAEGGGGVADQLEPVWTALSGIAQTLAAHLPAADPHARRGARPAPPAPDEQRLLLQRADDLAASIRGASPQGEAARGLAEVFDAVYAVVTGSGSRSGPAGASLANAVPRLVGSVLRPLADALARYPAGAPGADVAGSTDGRAAQPPHDLLWPTAKAATRLRVRLAEVGDALPELAEATAALQSLACELAPPGEEAKRRATFWDLQASLPPSAQTARAGPYLVTNVANLSTHLGERMQTPPQVALCRCGSSSVKPFCDGTHADIGFSEAKDPKRVPDRRDTYPGQQVTIFDNRGICQHSGFCTDRLASAFRVDSEPFVAPSGGRMDEIIRAVRDCPSGALSLALGGDEARAFVDWDHGREPAIEVTKDGPYRITGGIPLVDAVGAVVARAEGASGEHYALCRCGHSQNKPFCSGMHWYVRFRDPVTVPGSEPTLFEWVGGLPALTRMTRLLYEKHVPADPLLAPLFANIPADHPRREAHWLAEVFGGPAHYTKQHGGYQQMAARHAGREFTEDQRARWVILAGRAAKDAGLPDDPAFAAALHGCLEWGSRVAVAQSCAGVAAPADEPMPHWDWSAAGPPDTSADAGQDEQAEQDPEPVALPGPGEPVGFDDHIRPLFRHGDQQAMSFAFDLWSYEDVRAHAGEILERLQGGSMPCDGAWPREKVEVFQRWTESGMQR